MTAFITRISKFLKGQRVKIISPLVASTFVLGLGASVAHSQTELVLASTLPEGSPIVKQVFAPWVKEVNEAAKGKLVIKLRNGPTLASHLNVYKRVNSGIVDMGWAILGSVGVPFPRTHVSALPFLVDDPKTGSVALWNLYKTGLLDGDYNNIKMISLVALPSAGLHSNTPIDKMADLDGMKVRTADKISTDMLSALGASPVAMATVETYQALDQGVVNASFTGWTGLVLFKLHEVTKEHLDVGLASGPAGILMNKEVYASLDDEQKKILETAGDQFSLRLGSWFVKITNIFRGKVKGIPGHTIRTLSDEELAKWVVTTKPVIGAWTKRTPDGAKIIAAFQEELAKAK